ncbi:MAG: hypothetical protein NTY90_02975 [Candidatus Micrarchaeota archaeon]|nr:hypothetical protein [Candidatus Micrarchaeota archaeon]
MESLAGTRVLLTERYARFGTRPGLYKFVYHAPGNAVVIGTAEDTHQGLYSALKKSLGIKAKKSDFSLKGVFNRRNNSVWLRLDYKEEHAQHVTNLAQVLKREGMGHFALRSIPSALTREGVGHFTIRKLWKSVPLGTVKEIAEGRSSRPAGINKK